MKHQGFFYGWVLLALVLVAGCKKSMSPAQDQQHFFNSHSSMQSLQFSDELKEKVRVLRSSLPAGHEERFNQIAERLVTIHPEYASLVKRALHMAPDACENNTAISQWLQTQLADWDADITYMAVVSGMFDFPKYDAMLFENNASNHFFGVTGSFSPRVTKTFKDLNRFWDIESDQLMIAGLHGSMLRDREKVIRMNSALYGHAPADAAVWADLTQSLLDAIPQYRNGDHPVFSFIALAQPRFFYPPVGVIPEKIMLGDGLLEGMNAIGFGDVAPQAIEAHEYGHHIQFQLQLNTGEISAEASRRSELMADAFAGYYLSHARGANMQWKRVTQFLQVFFNIGDCGVTSTSHHGTPAQRMAAAGWGYLVAEQAKKQGHILPAEVFAARFDARLPLIISLTSQ